MNGEAIEFVIEDESGIDTNACKKSADTAVWAFYYDHPECFTLLSGYQYTIMGGGIDYKLVGDKIVNITTSAIFRYSFRIGCNWSSGVRTVSADESIVDSAVAQIAAAAESAGNNYYVQLKSVCTWLSSHNSYNYTARDGGMNYMHNVDSTPWSAISALDDSLSPVCEGYARAFKMICDVLNIPCIEVGGTLNGNPHAWNYVKMEDGKWYQVDATGNRLLFGSSSYSDQYLVGDYSLSGVSDLNVWDYPTLSASDYDPNDAANNVPASVVGSFKDVLTSAWYADSVTWAVDSSITNGTSSTTFSPNSTCTRGQIITFLYRAAGSPAVTGTVNVSDAGDTYYTDAVLWAAENEMFSGSTFLPEAPCTRSMVVDFMWKYAGSPAVDTDTPFTDVTADDAPAVAWAVENGVTNGTSETTFSPEATCTRAQIVTFLYRAFS